MHTSCDNSLNMEEKLNKVITDSGYSLEKDSPIYDS